MIHKIDAIGPGYLDKISSIEGIANSKFCNIKLNPISIRKYGPYCMFKGVIKYEHNEIKTSCYTTFAAALARKISYSYINKRIYYRYNIG